MTSSPKCDPSEHSCVTLLCRGWAQKWHSGHGRAKSALLRSSDQAFEGEFDESIIEQLQLPFASSRASRPVPQPFLDRREHRHAVLSLDEPIHGRQQFHSEGRFEAVNSFGGAIQDLTEMTRAFLSEKCVYKPTSLFIEPRS